MNSRMTLRMVTLAGLLALSTAACSSTDTTTTSGPARLSSSAMCKAAGGTYANGICQPGGSALNAQKMCEAHNGTYFAGGDYCEVAGIRKP